MKNRNILNANGTLNIPRISILLISTKVYIHFEDDTYKELDLETLKHIISNLSYVSKINGDIIPGTEEHHRLSIRYRPKVLAFFIKNERTDSYSIVLLNDFNLINEFIRFDENKDYISVKEFSKIHNKSPQQIRALCGRNKFIGAYKDGRDWKIPRFAKYPKWGYGK